jgi:hypothetical protein
VSLNRFHLTVMSAWFMTLVVVSGIGLAVGVEPSLTGALGAMVLAIVPAVILLMVFRGAPPRTIAEVLQDAERSHRDRVALAARLEKF